ncbi:MAG: sigma-54 dependent transcriptional regulator [Rikenellaceae bacterium]|jgi:DNA-binding NtrC family response regulator|nr:sigma-54 dependent transcriptional regulator [Rikenellaceae bacterium]
MDLVSVKQRFGVIGNDEALDRALEVALRVASTDLSVLVTGESGVGKEFFPQIIHAHSPRKHRKYIAVNCGAIPEGTIDSELFGHEKGSFTGASEARKGYFEEAEGGTIFLDEVAELPHSTQVRLLRVLQTGEFIRVGSSKTQKSDVRVIAATNIDLPEAIRSGRFREDLYYRLNTVPIFVPPLRERREDVSLLFRKFASDVAAQYRMPAIRLDEGARQMLENYYWPGNVRQLKNVAEQISAVEQSREIDAAILARYLPVTAQGGAPVWLGTASRDMADERELLYKVLFDMRAEIFEIKQMLARALNVDAGRPYLLGAPSTAPAHEMQFADTEEVAPDAPADEMTKERAQREAIVRALRKHGGRRKDAARELFMSERTLYRKIKELGIDE